jgi:hypothetical protein
MNANPSYDTLGEVNKRLQELGLQAIDVISAQEITKEMPKTRFVQALKEANENTGAMNFLRRLIASKNKAAQPQKPQAPAPAQAPSTGQNSMPANQHDQAPAAAQQHAAPPQRQPEERNTGPSSNKEYVSHHVYGGKAALCWNVDETRAGEPTIRLEAAKSIGERQYDWSSKIAIQFTRDELTCTLAVLTGALEKIEGKNHGVGDQAGKGFEIADQGKNFFVRVYAPNAGACAVPMTPEDAFTVCSILLKQMQKGKPWLTAQDLISLSHRIVGRMKR